MLKAIYGFDLVEYTLDLAKRWRRSTTSAERAGGSVTAEPQVRPAARSTRCRSARAVSSASWAGSRKKVNGETLVRNFIRADVFTSPDDALGVDLPQGAADHRSERSVAVRRWREGSPVSKFRNTDLNDKAPPNGGLSFRLIDRDSGGPENLGA